MENKNLSLRELSQIKRIAQNVDADYQKVCKLNVKIDALVAERDSLQQGIDEMEAPVIRKTGGYKSTDIYEKQVIPQFNTDGTPKTDKDGRQLRVTKYILKYPDTIVPVSTSNNATDIVPPTTEGKAGSDFDADVSNFAFAEPNNEII